MAPSVLCLGIPSTSPLVPDHVREGLQKQLDAMDEDMKTSPYDWEFYPIDLDTPFEDIIKKLHTRQWDVVLLGGGLRTLPQLVPLLEKLVNTVHEEVPKAKIAFNVTIEAVQEACRRVLPV